MKLFTWRWLLGRIPLPMLALAASHGVYSFGRLYMPVSFSLISAAAFELTYCGLAVAELHSETEQRRARNISIGAVVVSILYNAVAAYFHRNPAMLASMPWYGEVCMAVLHAAPLASVAYLVSSLLLHTEVHSRASEPTVKSLHRPPPSVRGAIMAAKVRSFPAPQRVTMTTPDKIARQSSPDPRAEDVRRLRDNDKMTYQEIADTLGLKTRQSAENLYKYGKTYAPRKSAE